VSLYTMPDGARWKYNGHYYKLGRHNLVFRYSQEFGWVNSTLTGAELDKNGEALQ